MAIIAQRILFTWKEIENLSEISRLRLVLESMPDEDLMDKLEKARKNGRDDYPVRAVWNSLLSGIIFQHPSVESLRRELKRNAQLCWVCGFDLTLGEEMVPPAYVYSRFIAKLMKCSDEVEAIFSDLVNKVMAELPDFGETLAVDGKALTSVARGRNGKEAGDRRRESDADWGVKQYTVNGESGHTERKVKRWFGFK